MNVNQQPSILLIWPSFAQLSELVETGLRQYAGAKVRTIHFDRAPYAFCQYFSVRQRIENLFLKHWYKRNLKKIQPIQKILQELKDSQCHFDLIIVNRADMLDSHCLEQLKNHATHIIAHHWDSMRMCPLSDEHKKIFDRIYSFDKDDCTRHNFSFLPNFFVPTETVSSQGTGTYCIMGLDSARVKLLEQIASQLEAIGQTYQFLGFGDFPSPYITRLNSTRPYPQVLKDIESSFAILDLQRGKWSGLSFRCFEALGMHKKLITDNTSIESYDFFNPNNIWVLRDGVPITQDFFQTPYQPVPENIKNQYSLKAWARELTSITHQP